MDEFTRELDMMRRLHHPNIITFIGASFIPGKMGIITEYCKYVYSEQGIKEG